MSAPAAPADDDDAGLPAPGTRPESVDAIFDDHVGRRLGLLAALTRDLDALHAAADPARTDPLCLSASPDASWRLTPPHPKVPPSFPEPCIGINFARDGLSRTDWAALVAVHADAWLRSVAAFQAAAASLTASGRAALFGRVNALATLYEEVQASAEAEAAAGAAAPPPPPVATGSRARPPGRLLSPADVTPALRGTPAALYWPDDDRWYPVVVESVAPRTRSARVAYETGEVEALDLGEVMREGHMVVTGR